MAQPAITESTSTATSHAAQPTTVMAETGFRLLMDVDARCCSSARVIDRHGRVLVDIAAVPVAVLVRFCLLPRDLIRSGCFACDAHLARRLILAGAMLKGCVRVVG